MKLFNTATQAFRYIVSMSRQAIAANPTFTQAVRQVSQELDIAENTITALTFEVAKLQATIEEQEILIKSLQSQAEPPKKTRRRRTTKTKTDTENN